MAYTQPYMNGYYTQPQMKTPEQMQAETMAMLQQYTQAYRGQQQMQQPQMTPQQPQQTGKSTSGAYSGVASYSEVEQASTPIDGTASLFFDFANGVFWSKKFVNGRHEVSAYYFKPINETESRVAQDNGQVEDNTNNELLERIDRLEKALLEKQPKQTKQKKPEAEVVIDEI